MNIALILSGGTGSRLGADVPKQYIKVKGRMIISYCMETIMEHPLIDKVQMVADPAWREAVLQDLQENHIALDKLQGFTEPGLSRQESIRKGLLDIRPYANQDAYIMIHDAARPLLSSRLITACLEGVKGHDGLMPVLPVKDTMYLTDVSGKKIKNLVNRQELVAGQAPEVFDFKKYYQINKVMTKEEMDSVRGSTEPAYRAGFDMVLIHGEEINFKITTPADLERFSGIVK